MAIVAVTVVALVLAQFSALAAAFPTADAPSPCHEMLAAAGLSAPASDEDSDGGKAMPDCAKMLGAICLSLCGIPAPATAQITGAATSAPHDWLLSAAMVPQVIPPPQRPPNRF
jgi:hypothetical protein